MESKKFFTFDQLIKMTVLGRSCALLFDWKQRDGVGSGVCLRREWAVSSHKCFGDVLLTEKAVNKDNGKLKVDLYFLSWDETGKCVGRQNTT